MTPEIQKLLQMIERRLDWGVPAQWQSRDFDALNQRILDETGVSLSSSTLKRVWGRARYAHVPSGVTLDTLARFAGFQGYRAYLSSVSVSAPTPVAPGRVLAWPRLVLITLTVILIGLAGVLAFKKRPQTLHNPSAYHFGSKTVVARGVPNSVVFSYDAPVSPDDSVFIQQSWDPKRREQVDGNGHQHTSIYYRPGFFSAKLIIDTQVVKEHPLMIATEGWLGMVENEPVPVYLKAEEFLSDSLMRLPLEAVAKKAPFTQAQPPKVRFYNVGNFDPVPVPELSFSAEIRNEYGDGAGACRASKIYLITDDGYGCILVPLSMKGCVSELGVFCVDHGVSGKNADLSGFGLDTAGWATVACRSIGREMQFYVNDRLAYKTPLPAIASNVVGIEFVFVGTGAVRNVRISKGNQPVLQAF